MLLVLFFSLAAVNSCFANSYFSIDTSGNVKPYSKENFHSASFESGIVAIARYVNRINSTGWAEFDLQTNAQFDDHVQAYFGGILEASLTAPLIDDFRTNIELGKPNDESSEICQSLKHFITANLNYIKKNLNNGSVYWEQIGLVLYQLAGLDDGYNAAKGTERSSLRKPHLNINPCNSFLLNMFPEVDDAIEIATKSKREELSDHCSAIIKWIPEQGEVVSILKSPKYSF